MNATIPVNVGMSGRLKLDVYLGDVLQRSTGWFDNIIVNGGLEYIGTEAFGQPTDYCQVGTGSTTPVATDTVLQTFLAGTSTDSSGVRSCQGSAPYYGSSVFTYTFATGAAAGNISEIGIANKATPGAPGFMLFSRALILDGVGNPTVISILASERLVATYELRLYPPLTDVVTTNTIGGISYTVTLRASNVTLVNNWANGIAGSTPGASGFAYPYTGALGAITAQPASATSPSTNVVANAYVSSSLSRSYVLSWDTTLVGTITAIKFATAMGEYQIGFAAVSGGAGIPKLNTQTLVFTVSVTWSRHTLP